MRRRDFLKTTALTGAAAATAGNLLDLPIAEAQQQTTTTTGGGAGPRIICSANPSAHIGVEKAMDMLKQGSDALDAVIAAVNVVEDDPKDHSVGLGGLPNEEGVVELDAAVMHGPSYLGGAVASLRNIRNPSKVARVVMERTNHALIVGEGALKFAKAHGFKEEELLTDEAREIWLAWKENLSTKDDWFPPHNIEDKNIGDRLKDYQRHYGTIHCGAIDMKGNLSCTTTTAGLAFKIPGRVGDSPIFGAGLYCDNEVGTAGSTGRGESNLLNCSSFMIVEWMRQGKSPEDACLLACQRIIDHTKEKRLFGDDGKPNFGLTFYAMNIKGEYGGAALTDGVQYHFHDGNQLKTLDCAYLYKKK
jgi:N4-(beta-N-acetylglucosaminyl)-L-asparaginase